MRIKTFVSCICAVCLLSTGAGYPAITAESMKITDELAELLLENEQLKAENAQLKAEVTMWTDKIAKMSQASEILLFASDKIERCDINGDGSIDANDASIVLQAYALLSTGENIWSISQVVNWDYIKAFESEVK